LRRPGFAGDRAAVQSLHPTDARRNHMKVVHCPCGTDVSGETDDDLVENVEAHIAEDHPDLVGKYSRDDIVGMAHDH
jgi:hypothetical protein